MVKITDISQQASPSDLLDRSARAISSRAVEQLIAQLPIVDDQQYEYDHEQPTRGWKEGHLHWVPVGRDRGNAGRIKLAGRPINPVAERAINAMEAMIELARQRELATNPNAPMPSNPREAVMRYYGLPSLEQLPAWEQPIMGKTARAHARELARNILVELAWDKPTREFSMIIRDRGIGQPPSRMHKTLLSLGSSDKGDKPYLIGVFGQGGSSAFAASKYSCIISRRAPDLLGGDADGVGWTLVKHVFPRNRRDTYFAYLASHPDGRVPSLPAAAAKRIDLEHGSRFAHVAYDFGKSGSAFSRKLYQSINHVLFNPVLPFDTMVSGTEATIYGNGYRLSNLKPERKDLDKTFSAQPLEA